jgi:triacylglycerol lipase
MQKKEAEMCAVLSHATYLNRIDYPNFTLTAKFDNAATDTQGLVGVAFGDTFMLGFRGSEETGTADWITDLKFILSTYPYAPASAAEMKVHYGFIQAYSSVRDAVLSMTRDNSHRKVITTGHSLGGALAILAAMDIQQNIPGKEISCYTFGGPRVGDPTFAAAYEQLVPATYRFVNDADLIPAIPPRGYQHVGKLIHMGANVVDTEGIIDALKEKAEDHFPHHYITAVRNLDDSHFT